MLRTSVKLGDLVRASISSQGEIDMRIVEVGMTGIARLEITLEDGSRMVAVLPHGREGQSLSWWKVPELIPGHPEAS